MNTFKPNELAALCHISPNTLRKWASDYSTYLSLTGQGGGGARRSYTSLDARVLFWIASLKRANTPAADIEASLESAQSDNWQRLPMLPEATLQGEPISVMPREVAEERITALKSQYEARLSAIQVERDRLKAELATKQHELESAASALEVSRREAAEAQKALQERITELTAQESELRGLMDQYIFAGRRISAVVLILVAIAVGAMCMVITAGAVFLTTRPR